MAKFNPILGHLSGRLAGNVFSHNPSGAYVRPFAQPVDPMTPAQAEQRAQLAQAANFWSLPAMTQAYRDAWDSWALAIPPRIDRLGNPYNISGFNAFCWVNVMMGRLGFNLEMTPPSDWSGLQPTDLTCTVAAMPPTIALYIDSFEINEVAQVAVPADNYMVIWAGKLLSSGQQFDNDLRWITVAPPAAALPFDFSAWYHAIWGTPIDTSVGYIKIGIQLVNRPPDPSDERWISTKIFCHEVVPAP